MQTFPIAQATSKVVWWFPLLLGLILLLVMVAVVRSVAAARTATFTVSADGLQLRGDWYGRFIPAGRLDVQSAQRVELSQDSPFRPRFRTMGTGFPGYQAGWFRLRNGERALLYLTDRTRAVHVPTLDGFGILVSPDDPDGFVAALQQLRH